MDNDNPNSQSQADAFNAAPNANPVSAQSAAPSNVPGIFPHRPDFQSAVPAGDIILTPDATTKKSKKPWIVAGGVAAVLIVGVIIAIVCITNKNHQYSVEETQSSFARYGNYLLFGQEDNDTLIEGEFSNRETYAAKKMLYAQENSGEYFVKLDEYYSDFYNKVQNLDIDISNFYRLKTILAKYDNYFQFIKIYERTDFEIDDEIYALCIDGDSEAAEQLISSTLNPMNSIESSDAMNFDTAMKKVYNDVLARCSYLKEYGCLEDGENICEESTLPAISSSAEQEADSSVKYVVKNLLSDVWQIQEELRLAGDQD